MDQVLTQETRNQSGLANSLAMLLADPDFVDLSAFPELEIDLRYASTNNFLGSNLFGVFNRAFLRKLAANQLAAACQRLARLRPGHRLVILDATRPLSVQHKLWEFVKGTEKECYVADPALGSIHNFGFAVDVTIVNEYRIELDMGTAFDTFDDLSQPIKEQVYREAGLLLPVQIKNRHLLREVMESAGFIQHPLEWWHFDALPQEHARRYSLVE